MENIIHHIKEKVWEILIHANIKSLPVNLSYIIKTYRIPVMLCSQLIKHNPNKYITSSLQDAFIQEEGEKKIIYLNDKIKTLGDRRFALSHQIAHILLNHPIDKIICNTGQIVKDNILEIEANIFARELLMPTCVLSKLHLNTCEQIQKACKTSKKSAQIYAQRLISPQNTFSKKEHILLHQFKDYIKEQNDMKKIFDTLGEAMNFCKQHNGCMAYFKCPLCGHTAKAKIKENSGHAWIKCTNCNFMVIE